MVLSVLTAFAACTDDVSTVDIIDGGKSPIAMSVGGMDDSRTLTRAVITDGSGKELKAMPAGTGIRTSMMSQYNTETKDEPWAYPEGKRETPLYCATWGTAGAETDGKAPIDFGSNARYWDDAHARSSMLSIWALAVPEQPTTTWEWRTTDGATAQEPTHWENVEANAPTQVYWSVSAPQTATTFAREDLCFCNNLADNTAWGKPDNRLKFNNQQAMKFDTGNLMFYHALAKLTIRIKCGDGFVGDGSDFQFSDLPAGTDNNFALKGFYGKGTFDLKTGEFQPLTDENQTAFSSIYLQQTIPQKKEAGDYYTLQAYVLPGTNLRDGSVEDAFAFTIDRNHYEISMRTLYDAIRNRKDGLGQWENSSDGGATVKESVLDDGAKLLAGVNYAFTFTVEKAKIKGLTAQVVDWEEVTADNVTPSNARISLRLEERGEAVTSGVDFYRALDPGNTVITDDYEGYVWQTGYTAGEKAAASFVDGKWTVSNWYWPDNTAYYHFRAVGDKTTASPQPPTPQPDAGGDYIALTHGETYRDYTWGAPFRDDGDNEEAGSFKWTYSLTKGFDGTQAEAAADPTHQIYQGIGPTNSIIKILMFHLMSDVTIRVKTTEDADRVTLVDGAQKTGLRFEQLHRAGKALMGNGCVVPTDSRDTFDFANAPTENPDGSLCWAHYGAIPQDLADVVLVITTPDKNQYRVAMANVLSGNVGSNNLQNPYEKVGTKWKINRWYPGFRYTYTFTLSKKKIENITATILDWEDVEAGDDHVQIQ